jgi:hypothetical protein
MPDRSGPSPANIVGDTPIYPREANVTQDTSQWQVTCPCGWRTHGTRDVVVAAVQEHGRDAHQQQLSEDEVMAIAVQVEERS